MKRMNTLPPVDIAYNSPGHFTIVSAKIVYRFMQLHGNLDVMLSPALVTIHYFHEGLRNFEQA